ncbi:MAG: preprotein translocase subunit SecE [bacterium]|nr:preprotein translocase subunit SecE [bacterium]
MLEKLINFLRDVRVEMKKVTWPTRSQAINYTIVVILISVGVALFLGALDALFTFVLDNFIL